MNIASRSIGAYAGLLEVTAADPHGLVQLLDRIEDIPGVRIAETLMLARSLMLPVSWRFTRETLSN